MLTVKCITPSVVECDIAKTPGVRCSDSVMKTSLVGRLLRLQPSLLLERSIGGPCTLFCTVNAYLHFLIYSCVHYSTISHTVCKRSV